MQCIKCNKIFRRNPLHKHRYGLRVRSCAKLCPKCRMKARSEAGKKSSLKYRGSHNKEYS